MVFSVYVIVIGLGLIESYSMESAIVTVEPALALDSTNVFCALTMHMRVHKLLGHVHSIYECSMASLRDQTLKKKDLIFQRQMCNLHSIR